MTKIRGCSVVMGNLEGGVANFVPSFFLLYGRLKFLCILMCDMPFFFLFFLWKYAYCSKL